MQNNKGDSPYPLFPQVVQIIFKTPFEVEQEGTLKYQSLLNRMNIMSVQLP